MNEEQRLKYGISISRRVVTAPYESLEVGYWEEFYKDEGKLEENIDRVKTILEIFIEDEKRRIMSKAGVDKSVKRP